MGTIAAEISMLIPSDMAGAQTVTQPYTMRQTINKFRAFCPAIAMLLGVCVCECVQWLTPLA